MTVGERLQALLKLRGLRVRELARRAGVREQTVYSLLQRSSKSARPDTLRKLAEALDAPLSYFYEEAPAPSARPERPALPVRRRRVPLLGDVAAGAPIFREEAEDAEVDGAGAGDFALRVDGDSMAPRIKSGDIVFVKAQESVPDGQIAVVIVDGEAALKRIYRVPGGVQLVSDNPAYAPMLFTIENSDSIRVLGRAVAVRGEL